MPSPLAHIATGVFIYKFYRRENLLRQLVHDSMPLLIVLSLSMLPDIDAVIGLLAGSFGKFHNNISHSFAAGAIVALTVAVFTKKMSNTRFTIWFFVLFLAYQMHVMMDYFTIGRGVMMFWPFSSERYTAPVKLFYGLHWSDGWFTIRHLWTLLSELLFILLMATIMRLTPKKTEVRGMAS